jgi:hypothetical protein
MSLTTLEQNLANLGDTLVKVAGQLIAENNPSYASLITLSTSLVDQVNSAVNPSAAPASAQITKAASDVANGITPVVAAVQTVTSKAAPAAAKASAIGSFVQEIELIGGDIISIFHKPAAPGS